MAFHADCPLQDDRADVGQIRIAAIRLAEPLAKLGGSKYATRAFRILFGQRSSIIFINSIRKAGILFNF